MDSNVTNFSFAQYLDFVLERRLEQPENIAALKTHQAQTPLMEKHLKEYRNLKRCIERYGLTL